ncbi:hypothetical protein Fcan01_10457 [Folsomia candida]|uniref:F-box domain-containing protein n=1 Tax=Folsomia candida TaxID=158441 RepID=A0A226E7V3_FOLCA|nr:hypothetical protein Fcan01_10457 [Folsomia candida]
MEQNAEIVSLEQLVLCNGLILPKILTHLPFRQYLATRLVSTVWDDAVRRTIASRARIDLSLCSIVKKADDKKKTEIEEKLDSIEYLKITELQIGIDDNLHPTIVQAFEEIGSCLTKLTVKINLEKGPDFADFFTLLTSSPNLKELIWWGAIDENHCHNYTKSCPLGHLNFSERFHILLPTPPPRGSDAASPRSLGRRSIRLPPPDRAYHSPHDNR